jgi:diaminohydroxyphosphoribosylaminopyrimidine deaminase/5-amino-6-(5-phosphoribosylamino)uracil reductase
VKIHQKYIRRCIQIAKNGLGSTRPNPMVGSVIVFNDKIIGEGYTSEYGGAHAEVNAINSVKDTSLLSSAVLYVSLEPCSHFGKTPPCSHLIVARKISKVVVGVVDDNSLVSGKGIAYLRAHGVEVIVGVLEQECIASNKRFFTFQRAKRPYIVLKWAETLDRFMDVDRSAGAEKAPTWISNGYSQQLVHKWRSEEHAILVGTNTVITDNPKLNVRSWSGKNPVRLILDNSLRIPYDLQVFDGTVMTLVFTSSKVTFKEEKDTVELVYIDYTKKIPNQICDWLYQRKIQSVLIEGGAQTIQSFIDQGLWDEARIFTGAVTFGSGIKAPTIAGVVAESINISSDVLNIVIPK